jgi:hypothetical protein
VYESSTVHELPSAKEELPVIVQTVLCPGLSVAGLQPPSVSVPPLVHVAAAIERLLAATLPTFLTVNLSVVPVA